MRASPTITGRLVLHPAGVRGHAYDASDLTRRLVVELVVDGWTSDLVRADAFAPEAAGVGDGCYGFGFALPEPLLDRGGIVEVRLANGGEPVGGPLQLPPAAPSCDERVGHVAWQGGLRLSGWVAPAQGGEAGVKVVVERRVVAEAAARGWTSVPQGQLRTTMAAFDVHLPLAYADGRVHHATVLDGAGRVLAGSPCPVLAFPDGLRAFLLRHGERDAGDPRAELIERLVPQSVPFADLDAWEARHPAPSLPGTARAGTVAVALLGEGVAASIDSLEAQRRVEWVALQLSEAGGPGLFQPAPLLAFLAQETEARTIVLALAGTRFRPEALARLAAVVDAGACIAYADAVQEREGGNHPLLWPAYDPERQLEQGYAALVFAASSAAVAEALRRGASSLFALFLGVAERGGTDGREPVHVPEILAALPRLDPRLGLALARAGASGAEAPASPMPPDVETGLPVARVVRRPRDMDVTVVVVQPEGFPPELDPFADRLARLAGDLVVVSHHPLALPRGWRNVVVAGRRNPSRLRNAAIAGTAAPRVLLIDAGVVPLDDAVMAEMAGRMEAPGVAAVSGTSMTPDGMILAAGAVLGPSFGVAPAFAGNRDGDGGYAAALRVARNCGALDAGCLMIDRAAAAAAGGFDELRFPEVHGGTDLSLKLRAAGLRLLVTPHAGFVKRSFWRDPPPALRNAELDRLRRRWGDDLSGDPFYHPALNRDAAPHTALAWPPLPRGPRRPGRPQARSSSEVT